jgi:hypothetical protein
MFSLFTWLRSRVRASILAGVNDALVELQEPAGDVDQAAALLRQRLTALPVPASTGTHDLDSEAGAVETGEDVTAKRSRRGRKDGDG